MTDVPRPFPRLTHCERIKETATFYRGRGVPVSARQVERALELTEVWRTVADARGVSDDDLAGVANLDDEALDAILASDRRIAHEARERRMADELDRGGDLPGLG